MQGAKDFNKSSKFVFDKDEEGYVKKLKKSMDVRVVLQLV